ncbi:MAG: GNAT family N-acetyltransferase [Pelatocladus maniniholoensis HA4357-MV3]|jgi:putative acetyltransferase|uniref:GNAT family N-acetyltransferase n=1 Tax=Pelatocladus maniniholoensis HA4357-MV3 TaxID=1117104 RepID=A0A9E3H5B5_9NOST|nr:GNAT family N-acetyltransferase [Pelatocladus maniniholoensis HA4357-MV3]BAZ69595.1 GCN5-related N-acetyltransferase [Fischerella sp. NIES-4106]
MNIRKFHHQDTQEIMQLFYDTVHNINIRDYTPEQVDAWAPQYMDYRRWNKHLNSKMSYVAELDEKIIGFAQLEPDGHIDCFYCHKDFQRMGVGSKLLDTLQTQAEELGIKRLFAEVSITAKAFFEHKGFQVINQQTVERRGVKLINYRMDKNIS